MAEHAPEVAARGSAGTLRASLAAYPRLAWMWSRTFAQYPVSMALFTFANAAAAAVELAALTFVFGHADQMGGFALREALLVFGLAGLAFGLANLLMGYTDRLSEHIRRGSFDVMLIRPVSPLVQLATDEFSPRRLGRVIPPVAALGYALATLDIAWDAARVALLPVLLVSGAAICCAVWVLASSVQFFLTDAPETTNSLTFGGQAAVQYPLAIYGREAVLALTFVVPLGFVSWQPALYLLDRPDPFGLPVALRFAPPLVAVVLCAAAGLVWRLGLRHYRSTGS